MHASENVTYIRMVRVEDDDRTTMKTSHTEETVQNDDKYKNRVLQFLNREFSKFWVLGNWRTIVRPESKIVRQKIEKKIIVRQILKLSVKFRNCPSNLEISLFF